MPLFKSKSRAKLCIQVRQDLLDKAEKLGIDIEEFVELIIKIALQNGMEYYIIHTLEEIANYFAKARERCLSKEARRILKEATESAEAKLRMLSQAGPLDTLPSEN